MESTLLNWLSAHEISDYLVLQALFTLMIGILFTQSGIDKVLNYKGEGDWYKDHFKKSFLGGMVPLLLPVITIFELGAGLCSLIGLLVYLILGNPDIAILGTLLGCLSIIQLFFGQRIAKDYAGAASLVPYFLLCAGGFFSFLIA